MNEHTPSDEVLAVAAREMYDTLKECHAAIKCLFDMKLTMFPEHSLRAIRDIIRKTIDKVEE